MCKLGGGFFNKVKSIFPPPSLFLVYCGWRVCPHLCWDHVSIFCLAHHILGDPGEVSRDATRIGTGLKFSSKARRAPGNIPLTDEFQSELNSDFLIGRKFPQLSFFRPIRELHTMKSDRDSLYQLINAISTVAIFFLSLSLSGSQNRHTMRRKFGSQRDPQDTKFDQFNLKDFVT